MVTVDVEAASSVTTVNPLERVVTDGELTLDASGLVLGRLDQTEDVRTYPLCELALAKNCRTEHELCCRWTESDGETHLHCYKLQLTLDTLQ